MMTYLITGGSGMLGSNLSYLFSNYGQVVLTYNKHPVNWEGIVSLPIDITDGNQISNLVDEVSPDVVIHAAAVTNVDFCEEHHQAAFDVNVRGSKAVARACAQFDVKMVYVSTDYVFDGRKGNYTEEDPPNPINFYGKTKLEGEQAVASSSADYCVLRTSLYGWNVQRKRSFVEWVIYNLQKGNEIFTLTDQLSSLMFTGDCAFAIREAINSNLRGTYHVASGESISKFNLAHEVASVFNLDASLIKPIESNELLKMIDQKAHRPKNVSLNVGRASNALGLTFPTVKTGLLHMKESAAQFFEALGPRKVNAKWVE